MPSCGLKFKILFLIIIFCGIFGLAKNSQAATYYVRPIGACAYNGNGTAYGCATGDGQPGAWIGLTSLSGLVAGDTTYICGKHRTHLEVDVSGNAGTPIVYDGACPDDPATIDTSRSVSGWTDAGGGIWTGANAYTRLLYENGVPLRKATASDLSDGDWYQDGTLNGLLYYRPTSGVPTDHLVERQTDSYNDCGVKIWNQSHIVIQNLTIKKSVDGVMFGSDPYTGESFSDISIKNNTISQSMGAIISMVATEKVGSDIAIENNTISYSQSGIKFLLQYGDLDANVGKNQYTTGAVIRFNTLTGTGKISAELSWPQAIGGVYDTENISAMDMSDSLIEQNMIIGDPAINDSTVMGIFLYGTNAGIAKTSGNTIKRNYIFGNSVGIYIGMHSGVSVGGSLSGNNAGVENNMVANNIVNQTTDGNGRGFQLISSTEDTNHATGMNYFVNNTLDQITSSPAVRVNGYNNGIWVFKNNSIGGLNNILIQNSTVASYDIDHNIYTADGVQKFYSSGAYKAYGTWKTDTGFDAHSRVIDPLFTNTSGYYATAEDFQLGSISPAINAGTDVGLTEDFDSNPIVGVPDIGAYEYQGDITLPMAPSGLSVN